MDEWVQTTLNELINVQQGYAFKSKDFLESNGVPVVKIKNVASGKVDLTKVQYIAEVLPELEKYLLREKDILIAMTGSNVHQPASMVGKVSRYNCVKPALLNQRVGRISTADPYKLDEGFLYYFLIQEDVTYGLALNAGGSANQANISSASIKSLNLKLPQNVIEQKAIAGVLSSLDDKIDLLHRQNKTLEALAETLFRQWFIEEAQDDWEEGSVSDFADHKKETVKPAKNEDTVFHHYSLPAFDSGKAPIEELGAEIKSNKYAVPKNSILISKLNPRVSRVWPISEAAPENGICSTEFQVALPKKVEYFCFVYSLFKSHAMRSELTACASGTSGSHQRVNPADIFDYEFLRPPENLIKKFSELVMPKIQKTFDNQKQIQTLEKLRDTLLPKLMSGEVRVNYDSEAA